MKQLELVDLELMEGLIKLGYQLEYNYNTNQYVYETDNISLRYSKEGEIEYIRYKDRSLRILAGSFVPSSVIDPLTKSVMNELIRENIIEKEEYDNEYLEIGNE